MGASASKRVFSTENPSLTYQDGDVIIHTSKYSSGIFVVHKDVLIKGSHYFRAALGEEWGRYAQSKSAGSPLVYDMDLEFDMDTSLAMPVLRVRSNSEENHVVLIRVEANSRSCRYCMRFNVKLKSPHKTHETTISLVAVAG